MQHRRLTVTMAVAVCALAIAACGGGGGGNPTPPVSTATPQPTPAAQQQQPVTSSSGGTVSASIPGGGTLSVQVPANSLSANATVTIYAYTSLSQMTATASSTSTAAKPRHAQVSVPNNGVFLAGFAIDTGSASVLVPLAVTETLGATVPSGDVVRVARFGKSGFTDVDTATVSGTSATNDVNAKYVSISGGGTAAPYILYAVPSSAAATPAPIAVTASPAPNQQIVIGANGMFTASGADANGNPLPFTPAFDTNNHAIATAATGSTPFTAVVTATTQGGVVDLVVADSRTKAAAKIPFTVYTQRPANSGDAFAFSGSLTQNDTFAYPAPTLPPTSVTANVTQAVSATATANPYASGGSVQDFNVVETDAYPTQTYKTTTDYYYQLASADFDLLGYSAIDDQGNTTAVQYATPQIVDELPEAANASWTNSPAMTLTQVFAGQETASRTVNADGTYTDTENAYQGTGSSTYPATTIILHDNADGSANMTFTFNWTGTLYNPPYTTSTYTWSETAPYVPSPAPSQSPGPPIIGIYESSSSVQSTPAPSPSPQFKLSVNQWYSSPVAMYGETDKNLGSATIPTACNVPSGFGTTAMHLQQQVNRLDTALGSTETTTTDSYVVTGFGPVCVQVSDKTVAYYDFQNDTGYDWYFSPTPVQTTNITETLTLQTSGTNTTPQFRSGTSVAQLQPISPAAVGFAREHVHLVAEHNRMTRLRAIGRRIFKAIVRGGLR